MNVSVLFITYNEEGNIKEMIHLTERILGKKLLEIIIIDDNSEDATWRILQDLKRKNTKIRPFQRLHERGVASAYALASQKARGDIIIWMDCDLQMHPKYIPRLLQKIGSYDVVIGSRYVLGGRDARGLTRVITSRMINLFAELVLGGVKDYDSGFVTVKKNVLKSVPLNPKGGGEYFIEFVYRCLKKGYKVTEVGFMNTERTKGISKSAENPLTLLRNGIRYGFKILQLRRNIKTV